jgi:hypothetical protein
VKCVEGLTYIHILDIEFPDHFDLFKYRVTSVWKKSDVQLLGSLTMHCRVRNTVTLGL